MWGEGKAWRFIQQTPFLLRDMWALECFNIIIRLTQSVGTVESNTESSNGQSEIAKGYLLLQWKQARKQRSKSILNVFLSEKEHLF